MAKPKMLLIAEKSSVMKDYIAAYKKRFVDIPYRLVFATIEGHIAGVPEPEKEAFTWDNALVIPQNFIKWPFGEQAVIPQGQSPYEVTQPKIFDNVVKALEANSDLNYIGIGTDSDVEGSLLFIDQASLWPEKFQQIPRLRLFINNSSEDAVVRGLNEMHKMDDLMPDGESTYQSQMDAAVLRGQMNHVSGMSYTRGFTVKNNGNLMRLGMVKGPILDIVSNRFLQFTNFVPESYFQIEATFSSADGEYKGKLQDAAGHNWNIHNYEKAIKAWAALKEGPAVVDTIETKESIVQAPKFPSLIEIQSEMAQHGFDDFNKTMEAMESLYNDKHILSYPRTNSRVLDPDTALKLPDMIERTLNVPGLDKLVPLVNKANRYEAVQKSTRYVNRNELDESHPALTLAPDFHEKFNFNDLSVLEKDIVIAVAARTMAILLPEQVNRIETIKTLVQDKFVFQTKNTIVINPGPKIIDDILNPKDPKKEEPFPELEERQSVDIVDGKVDALATSAPALFSKSNILKALGGDSIGKTLTDTIKNLDPGIKDILNEWKGIGTPATRGNIVQEMLANDTIRITTKKDKGLPTKRIIPTEKGLLLYGQMQETAIETLTEVSQFDVNLLRVQKRKIDASRVQQGYFKQVQDDLAKLRAFDFKVAAADEYKKEPNILGECPFDKGKVLEGKNSFYCENVEFNKETKQFADGSCRFLIKKNPTHKNAKSGKSESLFKSGSITQADIRKILAGKPTSTKQISTRYGIREIALIYNLETGRLDFFSSPKEVVGSCPLCGSDVYMNMGNVWCQKFEVRDKDDRPACPLFFKRRPRHKKSGKQIYEISERETFSKDEVVSILAGSDSSKKKINAAFGKVTSSYYWNGDKAMLSIRLENGNHEHEKVETGLMCPLDGGAIVSNGKSYYCANRHATKVNGKWENSGCPFYLSPAAQITVDSLKAYIGGQEIGPIDFVTKSGKQFSKRIIFNSTTGLSDFVKS